MKNTCTLLAECWGVDSQVNSGMTQQWLPSVPDWRLPWLITYGTKSLFYVCVIKFSSLSPFWVQLSGDGHQNILCHLSSVRMTTQLQFLSQTLSPLHRFSSLGRSKWHMYTGTSGRRGETVWLIGDISPEGMPPAFLTKKKKRLTVSVRSFGRHGHQEAGDWRGPEWQKTRQNWDNK